jgi:hypothetical protein
VSVVGGGQPGADVEELADAHPTGQPAHGPAEKGARGAGELDGVRKGGLDLVTDLPVDA